MFLFCIGAFLSTVDAPFLRQHIKTLERHWFAASIITPWNAGCAQV